MDVIRAASAETYEPNPGWRRASLCAQDDISIEHFVKPPQHASPRHDHPNAQVLVVLEGRMRITTATEDVVLAAGDTVYIPGGEPHVVTNPDDTAAVGIDIFVPGRSFDFWLQRSP